MELLEYSAAERNGMFLLSEGSLVGLVVCGNVCDGRVHCRFAQFLPLLDRLAKMDMRLATIAALSFERRLGRRIIFVDRFATFLVNLGLDALVFFKRNNPRSEMEHGIICQGIIGCIDFI